MTTIAYREGVLAADTGMTAGEYRVGHTVKITRGPTGNLGAAAGSAGYAGAFRKWVAEGEVGEPPEPKETDNSYDRGVVFLENGNIDVHEPDGRFECTAGYYALGSGRPVALGAMCVGASAEEAVLAAIAHDPGTFGEVTVLKHDGSEPPRSTD